MNSEDSALASAPSLFLCSFPRLSDTVRLDFAAPGPDNYVEIDGVLLIGASTVNALSLTTTNLVFLQDTDSDYYFNQTSDSFTFVLDDRQYYMRYRDLDINEATITLDVSENIFILLFFFFVFFFVVLLVFLLFFYFFHSHSRFHPKDHSCG